MASKDLIPNSPTEAEYAATFEANAPPLPEGGDPFALFESWLAEALKKEPRDNNAMAVATVDESGMPDVRMVLLKDFDHRGFTFYTNLGSAKGRQLAAHPKAALLFHWKSLSRQIRIQGEIGAVSAEEADAYFATRSRDSRIGAWASDQSRPLESRFALEKKVAQFAAKFGLGTVPRPPHWSGFRLAPTRFEFWRERPFRLHDRLIFTRAGESWTTSKLYP